MNEFIRQKAIPWLKQEALLVISWVLAGVSMFWVKPDREYIAYVDWHTIGLLFALMAVMVGLERLGFFRTLGEAMLQRVKSKRQLEAVLILLCFFSSMVITNDVALITFVPFSIEVLKMAQLSREMIPIVVLQTIAANLGSMLTPIGNPQNLYLFSKSGISLLNFIGIMLPYAALSFALICIFLFCRRNETLQQMLDCRPAAFRSKRLAAAYGLLFTICLGSIAEVLPVWILVLIVIAFLLVADRGTLWHVDYTLLLTFIGFFIFVGNMGRIAVFHQTVAAFLEQNDFFTILGASQIISNVPAVLLLSGFTTHWDILLIASNLGGLGTLIASMASLISYKCVVRETPKKAGRYLVYFTIANLIFLAVNVLVYELFRA